VARALLARARWIDSLRRAPALWLALALTVLPVVIDVAQGGVERAFGYVAADAFYYLVVARNVVDHGLVSFDQSHLTNGFQPLWQLVCIALFGALRAVGAPDGWALPLAVLTGACLLGVGVYLFGRALQCQLGRIPSSLLLLPVGLYALAMLPARLRFDAAELAAQNPFEGTEPLFGTLWSFANGMESGAVFACAAWAGLLYVRLTERPSRAALAKLGLVCSLVVFARLDHGLFIAPLVAMVAWRVLRDPQPDRGLALFCLLFAAGAPVLAYLLANRFWFGAALPVSGSLKTTFPIPFLDKPESLGTLVASAGHPPPLWLPRTWRLMQILLPCLVAALYLALRRWRDGGARARDLGVPISLGILLLGAYDFFFVHLLHQGHWYFPVSVPAVTLLAILLVARRGPVSRRYAIPTELAVASLSLAIFFVVQRTPDYHAKFRDFYFREAPELKRRFAGRLPRLFSTDDGIVGFATGFPTMSATALMIDAEAEQAALENRLGELALERGYDLFTGLGYIDFHGFVEPNSRQLSASWMSANLARYLRQPGAYQYALEYLSKDGSFGLLRVTPRSTVDNDPGAR
jgi:hypothetical protein